MIRLSQRQVVLGVFSLLTGGALLYLMQFFFFPQSGRMLPAISGAVLFGGLLALYWLGWDPARYLGLSALTVIVAIVMPEPFVSGYAPVLLALIPVVALLLANIYWVLGASVAIVLALLARAGGQGVYTDPTALITFAMVVGGVILSRLVTEGAQREAEAQARRAEAALAQSEAQSAEVARKADELTRQNEEQRRLIDLVATLETPAVALAEGVLLAPVVGHLDSRRAARLTERLLHEVSATKARLVVLDIAGVPAVDSMVAGALLQAVQALRLLGCDVTITGISASIATTMTQLGISMVGVRTARTPQEALKPAVVAGPGGVHTNN